MRWIKAESPVVYEPTLLEFTGYKTLSKRDDLYEIRRLHFNISGTYLFTVVSLLNYFDPNIPSSSYAVLMRCSSKESS